MQRPTRRPDLTRTKILKVRLDERENAALDRLARRHARSRADLVRRLIRREHLRVARCQMARPGPHSALDEEASASDPKSSQFDLGGKMTNRTATQFLEVMSTLLGADLDLEVLDDEGDENEDFDGEDDDEGE